MGVIAGDGGALKPRSTVRRCKSDFESWNAGLDITRSAHVIVLCSDCAMDIVCWLLRSDLTCDLMLSVASASYFNLGELFDICSVISSTSIPMRTAVSGMDSEESGIERSMTCSTRRSTVTVLGDTAADRGKRFVAVEPKSLLNIE